LIQVLAGVNGAGKSSIGGAAIQAAGQNWYNPDEFAREMQLQYPDKPLQDINGEVWAEGLRRLQRAIYDKSHFTFETTLGGSTITNTLLDAIAAGIAVNIWYCGLNSVELHIKRVAERVARGGHDIPEHLIQQRYKTSIRNLCRLTPGLTQLAVYDNSCALNAKGLPNIRRLLHVVEGQVREWDKKMPDWAKPVAAVSLRNLNP